jgi:hypothetical protein
VRSNIKITLAGLLVMVTCWTGAAAASASIAPRARPAVQQEIQPALTPQCAHGSLAGSCGDQVSATSPPMGLAVTGKPVQNLIVTGKSNLSTSATDWYWSNSGAGKRAEWAPKGVESGWCLAQVAIDAPIVIRHCTGLGFQVWTFTLDTSLAGNSCSGADACIGTWANAATGQVFAVTRQAMPVVPVTLNGAAPVPSEDFAFKTQLVAQ